MCVLCLIGLFDIIEIIEIIESIESIESIAIIVDIHIVILGMMGGVFVTVGVFTLMRHDMTFMTRIRVCIR